MLLGIAREIVTPPIGTPLAGFGFRDHGSESILDDLVITAFWLQNESSKENQACIICADIIGFDESITSRIKKKISESTGCTSLAVFLCASHTHSGPQTCSNMWGVGSLVPEVVLDIENKIVHAAVDAHLSLHLVDVLTARERLVGYSINRRVIRNGHAESGPNPDGINDDEVTSILFRDTASKVINAVLFHFTCHPTTMGSYAVSSEYPGAARRHIESTLGGGIKAGFLPGCFGDVRPKCTTVGDKRFRRGQPEDIEEFGQALGDCVLRSISQCANSNSKSGKPSLFSCESSIVMRFEPDSSAEIVSMSEPIDDYSEQRSAHPTALYQLTHEHRLCIQRLDLTEELSLLGMGGEMCCEFGLFIKRSSISRTIIPVGYTNGIVGYIPTASMYTEGGYEVRESSVYFGLPAPFHPDMESIIKARIIKLLDEQTAL